MISLPNPFACLSLSLAAHNHTLHAFMDGIPPTPQRWPSEFVCPISHSVMTDAVVVASGQTYERSCIQAWFKLGQRTCLKQGTPLEHLFLIPNVAVKTAIQNLARSTGLQVPEPPSEEAAIALARKWVRGESRVLDSSNEDEKQSRYYQIERNSGTAAIHLTPSLSDALPLKAMEQLQISQDSRDPLIPHERSKKDGDPTRSPSRLSHSASGQTLRQADNRRGKALPLPLATRPLSAQRQEKGGREAYDEGREDEKPTIACRPGLIESLVRKLQHMHALELDQATKELRLLTRESAENRLALCEPELLAALVPHLLSRSTGIQVNSVAAMLNMSLEKQNKVKIVRAGAIPSLIDVLRSGNPEAQEYSAGAIFSLALNDENKIAIGVLGAIPPLIHVLRSRSSGARQDAAMALYHLSLAESNRSKLVKVGAVPILLNLAQDEKYDLASRALLILLNVAATPAGRTYLLEMNGFNALVGLLRSPHTDELECSQSVAEIQENAAAVLLLLSQSNLRFKSLAMQAGALDLLVTLSENGTPRAREKASALLAVMRGDTDSSPGSIFSRNLRRHTRPDGSGRNSSEF